MRRIEGRTIPRGCSTRRDRIGKHKGSGKRRRLLVSAFTLAGIAWSDSSSAARWSVDPSVELRSTWTDNAGFEDSAAATADLITEMIPRLSLSGIGSRFRVVGTVGLDALTYANGSAPNRYLPVGDLAANLEAIERFLFIDAGMTARQTQQDVFAPRPDGGANLNTATETQYRLAPRIEGRIGSDIDYRLTSTNSWTAVSGPQTGGDNGYLGEHVFRIERRPATLDWAFEVKRSQTQFQESGLPSVTDDSARAIVRFAITQEFILGVRGGYEKTNILVNSSDNRQIVYGGELQWRPSNRTDLNGFWEERFFGHGWQLNFKHRMPYIAWDFGFSHDVVTAPQAFLSLPPTNNVAALLDAAYTTRFPDPTERARFINDLIARQGLPSALATQTDLFAQRVSLVTSKNATVTFIGVRNTLAISAFWSKNEDVPDSVFPDTENIAQDGVSLSLSHQLTTATSLNVTGGYLRAWGLGASSSEPTTKQRFVRLQMTRQMAPKTTAYVGARVQQFDSNAPEVVTTPGSSTNRHEHAAFVGLNHRF